MRDSRSIVDRQGRPAGYRRVVGGVAGGVAFVLLAMLAGVMTSLLLVATSAAAQGASASGPTSTAGGNVAQSSASVATAGWFWLLAGVLALTFGLVLATSRGHRRHAPTSGSDTGPAAGSGGGRS